MPVFENRLHGYETANYIDAKRSKSTAVLFETEDGGRTWRPERLLLNLAVGEILSTSVVDSTWVLPFAAPGGNKTILKVRPSDRTTIAHTNDGDFSRCVLDFFSPAHGWMNCAGELSSSEDGGASWTVITPRSRNGALT
jgi:hypothetical protein